MRSFNVFFDIHAFTLANQALVNLAFRQDIRDIFASALFSNQFVIDIFGDLMLLVQVLTLVFDTDTANDAFKKLWSRQVTHSFPLADLDQDLLVLFPGYQMDHFHVGSNDVTCVLDFLVTKLALEHPGDNLGASVLDPVLSSGDLMNVFDVSGKVGH